MPTPSDYTDFRLDSGKDMSGERQQANQGQAGEYGQGGSQAPLNGDVSPENYPNQFGYGYDAGNRMFSQDKNPDPQGQSEEASGSAFAELQQFLMNSPYTIGSRVCHEQSEQWTPPHPDKKNPGDGKTGPA